MYKRATQCQFLLHSSGEFPGFPVFKRFYLPVYIGVVGLTPYKPVMKKYTDQQLQDKLNRYFLRYCEDLDKKGVEIIQNDVKIDTGSKEGSISGTLTIICNTGQSRQSEIPQLPNDPEEQIEQLGE